MTKTNLNTSEEIWKEIPGFPLYEVSNFGQVRSYIKRKNRKQVTDKPKLLKPVLQKPKHPRLTVNLCHGRTRLRIVLIHRLVLLAFVGPCPEGMVACHKDGNRMNNKLENLRWDTPDNNWLDNLENGQAVVTKDDIHYMRYLHVIGVRQVDISYLYGVSLTLAHNIVHKKMWKNV